MNEHFFRAHGIMFHHFYDDRHIKGQGAISGDQLEQMINYYKIHYNLLRADEWMNKAVSGYLQNADVCLTFDDTLLCQYEIAVPVLKKFNLTAFWFVYSSVIKGEIEMLEVYRKFRTVFYDKIDSFYNDFFKKTEISKYRDLIKESLRTFSAEKYLTSFPFYSAADKKFRFLRDDVLGVENYRQMMSLLMTSYNIDVQSFSSDLWMKEYHIRQLFSDGHVIGLHSHSHPTRLVELPSYAQKREYELNYKIISEIIGESPVSMSHPCNSYNEETLNVLEGLGIQLGFRANMEKHTFSKFEFPREDHANIIGKLV